MRGINFSFESEWEPFKVDGEHLTFERLSSRRLRQEICSHWGPAIYKWEGLIEEGPHEGEEGVLVGETGNLRQRIREYASGTQQKGNKRWRDEFLARGPVRLYILRFRRAEFLVDHLAAVDLEEDLLLSGNCRVVLEQLLVLDEVIRSSRRRQTERKRWVVNRKL